MKLPLALVLAAGLALAGCLDGAADELEGAAADLAAAPQVALVEQPFSFEGRLGVSVVACPVLTCFGAALVPHELYADLDGAIEAVALTMTWDAATPHTRAMRLGLAWGPEDDRHWEYVDGTSPLVLDIAGLGIQPDDEPYVFGWVPCAVPLCLVVATTQQSFHVGGTVTIRASAEAP